MEAYVIVGTSTPHKSEKKMKEKKKKVTYVIRVIVKALGGCSWPSLMHGVTHDFLVVHIKASQKSLGDKPKSVHIFLQTPREVYTRKSYFLDNSGNKHPNLTN